MHFYAKKLKKKFMKDINICFDLSNVIIFESRERERVPQLLHTKIEREIGLRYWGMI